MMDFNGPRAHKFTESPVLKLRLPAWRSRLMALLILGCFALLIGRSFYLQVLNNDFLQEKGESRYRRDLEISASRGRISDRNGDVLAVSTPMKSVWAIPADARLTPAQTKQLAALLEMDVKICRGNWRVRNPLSSCIANFRRKSVTGWRRLSCRGLVRIKNTGAITRPEK
jgi:cell division protein FtsI (penicillin-binding protein 3)